MEEFTTKQKIAIQALSIGCSTGEAEKLAGYKSNGVAYALCMAHRGGGTTAFQKALLREKTRAKKRRILKIQQYADHLRKQEIEAEATV